MVGDWIEVSTMPTAAMEAVSGCEDVEGQDDDYSAVSMASPTGDDG